MNSDEELKTGKADFRLGIYYVSGGIHLRGHSSEEYQYRKTEDVKLSDMLNATANPAVKYAGETDVRVDDKGASKKPKCKPNG